MATIYFIALLIIAGALARDDGRYANSPWKPWFEAQLVPGGPEKGKSCCTMADGVQAQEDIRDGHYWVTFETKESGRVGPMEVPDELVLKEPNQRGVPVVWYYFSAGGKAGERQVKIRCYAPGGGV